MSAISAPKQDTPEDTRPRHDWVVDMRSRRVVRRARGNALPVAPEPVTVDKEGLPSNP
jgi:hypothetical protein